MADEAWVYYECDTCGYVELEQLFMLPYDCPECDEGTMEQC